MRDLSSDQPLRQLVFILFGFLFFLVTTSYGQCAPVVADYTYTPSPACSMSVNFMDTSENPYVLAVGDTPAMYLWDFGDGNTSTDQNPSHTYIVCDDYTVKLTVTDSDGLAICNTDMIEKIITIEDTVKPTWTTIEHALDREINCDDRLGLHNAQALKPIAEDTCDGSPVVEEVTRGPFVPNSGCSNTGTYTNTWKAVDVCGNETAMVYTQVITVVDNIGPMITPPPPGTSNSSECSGIDPETNPDYIMWLSNHGGATTTDSCGGTVTWSNNASEASWSGGCINIKTVTYTATDSCNNSSTIDLTFTISDNTAPSFTAPSAITIYTDANCAYDASVSITGDVTDENDNCTPSTSLNATYTDVVNQGNCVGEQVITRTWHLEDACDNFAATQDQIITVSDNTAPSFTAPSAITIYTDANCAYDASVSITGDVTDENDNCTPSTSLNATYTDAVNEGNCVGEQVITRTWHLEDACGNLAATQDQIITISDNTAPTIDTEASDMVVECDGEGNTEAYQAWLENNAEAEASDTCSIIAWSNNASEQEFVESCGGTKSITVVFTATDSCGNSTPTEATFNIKDETIPDLLACDEAVIDEVKVCDGDNNSTIAEDWDTENIAALKACARDTCNGEEEFEVISDYDYGNLVSTCGKGGTLLVSYMVVYACGNSSYKEVTLTLEDTTAPNIEACTLDDLLLGCTDEDKEDQATSWDAENIAILEGCANDVCSNEIRVTSDFDIERFRNNGENSSMQVTYTIMDSCDNSSLVTANIEFEEGGNVLASNTSICISDEIATEPFSLFDLLEGDGYAGTGTWTVVSGITTLNEDVFSPLESEEGFIVLSYTEEDSVCPVDLEVTIEIHDRCLVLSCNDDEIKVSKTVTPNGDNINDYLEIKGIENCNYTTQLIVFNRWGAIIYKNNDYKNNWDARVHNASVGSLNRIPNGTYFYVITLIESGLKPLTGAVYIGTK